MKFIITLICLPALPIIILRNLFGVIVNGSVSTPLHCAIVRGDVREVVYLIDRGEDVNGKDCGGRTPLHEAVRYNDYEIASFLVFNGSDMDIKDGIGFSPLDIAKQKGDLFMIMILTSSKEMKKVS